MSLNARPSRIKIARPPINLLPYSLKCKIPMLSVLDRITFARWLHSEISADKHLGTVFLVMTPWWWEFYLTKDILKTHKASVVYDCFDDIPNLERHTKVSVTLARQEIGLLEVSSLVSTTSIALMQKIEKAVTERECAPYIQLLPNGVDFERFQARREAGGKDAEKYLRPRIGFIGGLGEWIDYSLALELANLRPDYDFIYTGPILDSSSRSAVNELSSRPNVSFTGKLPYHQVPAIIDSFDVCWVPFHTGGRMATVNSNKFYQYLAAGKPVVSTPIPEAVSLAPHLQTGVDAHEIAQIIDSEIYKLNTEKGHTESQERLAFAQKNSWHQRAIELASTISQIAPNHRPKNE